MSGMFAPSNHWNKLPKTTRLLYDGRWTYLWCRDDNFAQVRGSHRQVSQPNDSHYMPMSLTNDTSVSPACFLSLLVIAPPLFRRLYRHTRPTNFDRNPLSRVNDLHGVISLPSCRQCSMHSTSRCSKSGSETNRGSTCKCSLASLACSTF
jgi:hypothetical protein